MIGMPKRLPEEGWDQNRDPITRGYQYRARKGSKTRPTLEQAIIRPFAQRLFGH